MALLDLISLQEIPLCLAYTCDGPVPDADMRFSGFMAFVALDAVVIMAAPAVPGTASTQPATNAFVVRKPPQNSPVCNKAKTWAPDDLKHAIEP